MERYKLTEDEKKLLRIWHNTDEEGQIFMIDVLVQIVAFGEEWVTEMETYLEKNDIDGMKKAVARYREKLELNMNKSTKIIA